MTSWLRDTWLLDDGEVKPALALAMTLSRASMGVLVLRDGGNGAMRAVVSEGLSSDESLYFSDHVTALAPLGLACTQHRTVAIHDARVEALENGDIIRELSRRLRFRGMEILPLERKGAAALGALTLLFRQPLRVTPRAERLVALATAVIAIALDNARLRADAERRRRVAEQRAHDRLQFLARINHELRTPLQSITGYIELLRSDAEPPTARQREMLDRIGYSEQVLLTIIDDVASLGRVEAGRMMYTLTGVDVADVLARVESVVAPLALREGVKLQVDGSPGVPLAHADRGKLTQILINLVTNAIKVTRAGGTVTLQVRHTVPRVEFIVGDEGPGIPDDKLERIFEPYVQFDYRRQGPLAGFGLGLAISREFAVGMGGTLAAANAGAPGRGAVFTLSVRVHRPDRPAWRSRTPGVTSVIPPPRPNALQTPR